MKYSDKDVNGIPLMSPTVRQQALSDVTDLFPLSKRTSLYYIIVRTTGRVCCFNGRVSWKTKQALFRAYHSDAKSYIIWQAIRSRVDLPVGICPGSKEIQEYVFDQILEIKEITDSTITM